MARNLSIIILETLFTALCVVLVLVNLKYNHGCGGYDPGSATSRRVALERRLEARRLVTHPLLAGEVEHLVRRHPHILWVGHLIASEAA